MAIVMGLDQFRARITAGWIDTDSGEIGRARVSPAHRDDVRKFLERVAGQPLEVALEATTGWRFVVESCTRSERRPISPNRPKPRRGAGTSSAPRPTAPTPGACASG
jgi:hypothetical protein